MKVLTEPKKNEVEVICYHSERGTACVQVRQFTFNPCIVNMFLKNFRLLHRNISKVTVNKVVLDFTAPVYCSALN